MYENNIHIKTLIENIFYCGYICYDIIRHSPFLREDDYIVTIFSFPKLNSKKFLIINLILKIYAY
jgi:hypothetical protein